MKNLLAGLLLLPAALPAQTAAPGKNLSVLVAVDSVAVGGDTLTIFYRLTNSALSAEDVFNFAVDAPAPVLFIPLPGPKSDWIVDNGAASGTSVAQWGFIDPAILPPGGTSPQISFRARGLPTIVQYWVGGYFPPPADTLVNDQPIDYRRDHSLTGWTVGVEPLPQDTSLAGANSRLTTQLNNACAQAWVAASECASLSAHVTSASASIGGGDNTAAKANLEAFVNDLNAIRGGSNLTSAGFWLLAENAKYIIRRF